MDVDVVQALQKQLNHERMNAQKYSYMAQGFKNMAYDGFYSFFAKQAQDELQHAAMIGNLLTAKRIMPEYHQMDAVILEASVPYYARTAYQTELLTTQALQNLYNVAEEAGDAQVCSLVHVMLLEQIEEENTTADFLDQVTRTDANGWEVLDSKYK